MAFFVSIFSQSIENVFFKIIDREVDGKESIPYQKDKNNIRYGRFLAARRVARTVMLGSAPSTSALRDQGIRGLETSRILLGTVQPAENILQIAERFSGIQERLYHQGDDAVGLL